MKKFKDFFFILKKISEITRRISKPTSVDLVSRIIKNYQSYGRDINFELSFNILKSLKLIVFHHEEVNVSNEGSLLVDLNVSQKHTPNLLQKLQLAHLILENKNSIGYNYRAWLKLFKYDKNMNSFIINGKFYDFPYDGRQWLEEMVYLSVIIEQGTYMKITEPFVPLMCSIHMKKLNPSSLKKSLKMRNLYGEKAEEIVVKFEKARLTSLGREDLANRVNMISRKYSNEEYDVISFSGKNTYKDRFIEVKYSSDGQKFYISKNEIEISKIIGEKYWLYIVSKKNNSPKYEIQLFKNFHKSYESGEFICTPVRFQAVHINKKIKKKSTLGDFVVIETYKEVA